MAKYIAIIHADYSYDGQDVISLEGMKTDAAIQHLKDIVIGNEHKGGLQSGYHGEGYSINSVVLYEIVDKKTLPVERWYAEHERWQEAASKSEVEDKQRAEYERLREIYGND